MKQTFFAALITIATLTATTASAQSASRFAATGEGTTPTGLAAEVPAAPVETPAPAVSTKVLKAFGNSFRGAQVKWFIVEGNFLARFTRAGQVSHALFQPNGHMLYSVTKGSVELLYGETKDRIQSLYKDYDITSVSEATSRGITAYITHLQLGHSLIVIKVIDGEIVEEERYRTGSK